MAAEVGEKAPGFELPTDDWDHRVSLEEARREGPVVLFFYPGDWSSVCTDQMSRLQEEIGRFEELGAMIRAFMYSRASTTRVRNCSKILSPKPERERERPHSSTRIARARLRSTSGTRAGPGR